MSGCIRCERCYEACPRQAIVPAKIEDGLLGMRSPMLDFNTRNYCDFARGKRRQPFVRGRVPHLGARAAGNLHGGQPGDRRDGRRHHRYGEVDPGARAWRIA
ncbi:MAG: 4Fe-4S binding protein [Adlercreutzia equolifaciens]